MDITKLPIGIQMEIIEKIKEKGKILMVSKTWMIMLQKVISKTYIMVNLQCKRVSDIGLKYLKGANIINLFDCQKITDAGLEYIRDVYKISLRGCEQITDEGIKKLYRVKKIDIYGCKKITIEGYKYLSGVESITCDHVTDKGLEYLKKYRK